MNQTELEERLHAAYRARAQLVTTESLTRERPQLDAPAEPRLAAHRRALPPLLAAAAVVALAITVAVVARVANHKDEPAHEPLRFTTPNVRTWNGIGAGWTVALWAPTPTSAQNTIYLVSPTGKRRVAGTVAGRQLEILDWSADRSHVILAAWRGSDHWRVVTVDLRTGRQQQWAFTGELFGAYRGLASTTGTRLTVVVGKTVRVVAADGAIVSTRPATAADAFGALPATVDGRPVSITVSNHSRGPNSLTIFAANARVLGQAPVPDRRCNPLRPWNAESLLIACPNGFWAVPLDGTAPTLLLRLYGGGASPPRRFAFIPQFDNLFEFGGALYATEPPGCGSAFSIWRVGAGRKAKLVAPVDQVPIGGQISGVTDESFFFRTVTGNCQHVAMETLVRFEPAHNRVTPLLGDAANGGTVVDALTDGLYRR